MTDYAYPAVQRDPSVIDIYKSTRHGEVRVADPYRWLENPASPGTQAFVDNQNACLEAYLADYPHRDILKEAVKETFSYTTISAPEKQGDGYYYCFMKKELQNQPVLHRSRSPATLELGEVFYDVNSVNGTLGDAALTVFLGGCQPFSKSGKFWAYGVNLKGAAWTTVYVRPTTSPFTGLPAEEGFPTQWAEIKHVKFSTIAWNGDEGFFYQAYPSAEASDGTELTETLNSKLIYHTLGTEQSQDLIVKEVEQGHPDWRWQPWTTDDSRYLVVEIPSAGRNARLWVADLLEDEWRHGKADWVKVDEEGDSQWGLVTNNGPVLYLITNKDASRFKIVTFDMSNQSRGIVTLVEEHPKALLTIARPFNKEYLLLSFSVDVHSEVWLYSLVTGKSIKRLGPAEDQLCNVTALYASMESSEAFLETKGFTNPGLIWSVDETKMELLTGAVMKGLRSDDYVTKQVWYKSKDGTPIPMFLTHAKALASGPAPVLISGYGGFGSLSSAPQFNPAWMTFVGKFNGILAWPSLRGGGEYGKNWHLAGCRHNRQTVFDDMQCAARFLIG